MKILSHLIIVVLITLLALGDLALWSYHVEAGGGRPRVGKSVGANKAGKSVSKRGSKSSQKGKKAGKKRKKEGKRKQKKAKKASNAKKNKALKKVKGHGQAAKGTGKPIKASSRKNDGKKPGSKQPTSKKQIKDRKKQKAFKKLFRSGNFKKLAESGKKQDRNNLTIAGRALQKHGDRKGSVFPKSSGNAQSRNQQGQKVLEGILKSKNQTVRSNRFGGKDIFDKNTGRGVRFDKKGNMTGFLEP